MKAGGSSPDPLLSWAKPWSRGARRGGREVRRRHALSRSCGPSGGGWPQAPSALAPWSRAGPASLRRWAPSHGSALTQHPSWHPPTLLLTPGAWQGPHTCPHTLAHARTRLHTPAHAHTRPHTPTADLPSSAVPRLPQDREGAPCSWRGPGGDSDFSVLLGSQGRRVNAKLFRAAVGIPALPQDKRPSSPCLLALAQRRDQ